ncbi:MAG TPA: N-acetyltransferase [Bryobacteraceae bacterium]|nr:N-acetyltransferase [Bryobacteraceae bacterium]
MSFLVRKAMLTDVRPLVKLINEYAAQGIMLPRTDFELAENVRDFTVAEVEGEVAGCGALHFYGLRTGEVRSLAVHPDRKKLGIGRGLVEALESEALDHGLVSVFAFTYIPDFFSKLGYVEVDRRQLPAKVWKDCLRCPKLQCCDEIAMQKQIAVQDVSPPCGEEVGTEAGTNGLLIVPAVSGPGRLR